MSRHQKQELAAPPSERGDASTEFVMVSALLVLLTVAILQVSYAFYTRNILLDAASAGARYGTLYDRTPEEGRERAEQIIRGNNLLCSFPTFLRGAIKEQIIRGNLPESYAQDVHTSVYVDPSGIRILEVHVTAPLPVLGPWGFPGSISVSGHAAYIQS